MPRAIVLMRSRLPALCLAALLNAALIAVLFHALPQQARPHAIEPQTQVVFLPFLEPVPEPRHRRPRRPAASTAITIYVNPYGVGPQALQSLNPQQRLDVALASCAPENYDRETSEVRTACTRIRTALVGNRDRFGVKTDFVYGEHWQQELAKRNRPVLAPCLTPGGPDVLYLLTCVYEVLFVGYDSEKAPHY